MGCGVRALDPAYRLGEEGLGDGDVVEVDGLEIRVVGTPGHTADSLSFLLPAEPAVLTGDTVLGRGTTVVAHPDGQPRCLPGLPRPAARARRGPRDARRLAGPRPGHRRRPRGAGLLHRPPPRAPRAGPRGPRPARPPNRTRRASPPRSCPAGSSRSSTPTSTRSSGAPPSSPSAPSWPTCRPVELALPDRRVGPPWPSSWASRRSSWASLAVTVPDVRGRRAGRCPHVGSGAGMSTGGPRTPSIQPCAGQPA